MQGLNRIDLLLGFLLCLIGFGLGALSSDVFNCEDKAPLFLFVLNSATASSRTLPGNGGQLQLQIPRHSILSVQIIPTDLVRYSRNFVSQE